jgi:hypothetical protein
MCTMMHYPVWSLEDVEVIGKWIPPGHVVVEDNVMMIVKVKRLASLCIAFASAEDEFSPKP